MKTPPIKLPAPEKWKKGLRMLLRELFDEAQSAKATFVQITTKPNIIVLERDGKSINHEHLTQAFNAASTRTWYGTVFKSFVPDWSDLECLEIESQNWHQKYAKATPQPEKMTVKQTRNGARYTIHTHWSLKDTQLQNARARHPLAVTVNGETLEVQQPQADLRYETAHGQVIWASQHRSNPHLHDQTFSQQHQYHDRYEFDTAMRQAILPTEAERAIKQCQTGQLLFILNEHQRRNPNLNLNDIEQEIISGFVHCAMKTLDQQLQNHNGLYRNQQPLCFPNNQTPWPKELFASTIAALGYKPCPLERQNQLGFTRHPESGLQGSMPSERIWAKQTTAVKDSNAAKTLNLMFTLGTYHQPAHVDPEGQTLFIQQHPANDSHPQRDVDLVQQITLEDGTNLPWLLTDLEESNQHPSTLIAGCYEHATKALRHDQVIAHIAHQRHKKGSSIANWMRNEDLRIGTARRDILTALARTHGTPEDNANRDRIEKVSDTATQLEHAMKHLQLIPDLTEDKHLSSLLARTEKLFQKTGQHLKAIESA